MLSNQFDEKKHISQFVDEGMRKSAGTAWSNVMRWFALGAVIGPILFTLAWLVLGFLSPGYTAWGTWISPYSPISQGISGLGLGITAPFMNAAFVLSGLLMLLGVIGIFQCIGEMSSSAVWCCTLLLVLSPLGVMLDGIFTLETFMLHMLGFLLAVGSPVLSFVIIGILFRRTSTFRRLGNWLLLGSPLTLALTALYFLTFKPTIEGTQTGVAGLTERILVLELLVWFVLMGWMAFRRASTRIHA